jgi:hypothetical protein
VQQENGRPAAGAAANDERSVVMRRELRPGHGADRLMPPPVQYSSEKHFSQRIAWWPSASPIGINDSCTIGRERGSGYPV